MKKSLVVAFVALALCACKDDGAKISPQSLQNQAFLIEKLDIGGKITAPPAQDEQPSLSFESDRYNGFAACNSFFGTFAIKNDKIRLNADIGATKMMCPPEVMGFEDDLLANLYGEFALEMGDRGFILKSNKMKIYLVPKI